MTVDLAGAPAPPVPPPVSADRSGRTDASYRTLVWALRTAIVVVVLGSWQLLGTSSPYWELVVGSPVAVGVVLAGWIGTGSFWADLGTTLSEAALGYLLGVALAVLTVAVVASSAVLDRFLRPFISALNCVPKVALAPLFLVWFGINMSSKVYFVASMIYFIVFYGIYAALTSIDRSLIDNTRALGASTAQLVRHVYGPATMTWLISSLRVGAAFALLAAIFAEFLGATGGLGQRISQGLEQLQNNDVMAGILVVAVVALLLDRGLVSIERRFKRWKAF